MASSGRPLAAVVVPASEPTMSAAPAEMNVEMALRSGSAWKALVESVAL
jgi:hypothetical protein